MDLTSKVGVSLFGATLPALGSGTRVAPGVEVVLFLGDMEA